MGGTLTGTLAPERLLSGPDPRVRDALPFRAPPCPDEAVTGDLWPRPLPALEDEGLEGLLEHRSIERAALVRSPPTPLLPCQPGLSSDLASIHSPREKCRR